METCAYPCSDRACSSLSLRKYKYNRAKVQHWLEHEWTGTASDLTKQGESRNLTTACKDLDSEALQEVPDFEPFAPDDGDDPDVTKGAQPFEPEV